MAAQFEAARKAIIQLLIRPDMSQNNTIQVCFVFRGVAIILRTYDSFRPTFWAI